MSDTQKISLSEFEEALIAEEEREDNQPDFPEVVENVAEPVFFVKDEMADMRSFDEKMKSLIGGMPGQRFVLLAILKSCIKRKDDEALTAIVSEEQKENRSVYSTLSICKMLQRVGALDRVLEDGSPYVEEDFQPQVAIDEDGQEYVQAIEPPVLYWETTEEGIAFANADDPVQRTLELFEENAKYQPIYRGILDVLSDGAVKTATLTEKFDDDELLQEPRFYTAYFLEQLEDAGAVRWTGSWEITDTGRNALAKLS